MNQVTLFGRMTADPELKYTTSGKAVVSFTLAVNGIKEDDTQFINVVAWDKQAEYLAQYQHKGNRLLVSGRLQVRKYEAQDGSKRYVTEVVANTVQGIDKSTDQMADATADDPFGRE